MTGAPADPAKAGRPRLDLRPRPGAAPLPRMVLARTWFELRLLLRNGEQLLLTLAVPTVLLVALTLLPVVDVGPGPRVAFLAPGILALAILSTAFTGQAIATGFERRYGVLKRLAATPLPRWGVLVAKTLVVLAVEALQLLLLSVVALLLGWRPQGTAYAVVALVVLGTAACSVLGLLMAGTLRAEATLAGANLVYLLMLLVGGVVVPLSAFPGALRPALEALPVGALAEGLRAVLRDGGPLPWANLGVLGAWTLLAGAAAARTFRWE